MIEYCINEDKLPPKLPVIFSKKITNEIDVIGYYNRNSDDKLSMWHDYLNGIMNYISNPAIAWDNTNRYIHFPNGATYIKDFDFNVGFTIRTNCNKSYVYVFTINLKPEEFGLKVPPILNENKQHTSDKIIYRIKESQLRRIIRESIKKVLNII